MRDFVKMLVGWGPLGVFAFALLDSGGVPMVGGVDALLLTVSAVRPELAYLSAVAALLGSLLGSWFLFALARKGGEAYLERHTITPRGRRLRNWFQHYGLITIFIPALLPIPLPLKIPVLCAGALGITRRSFLGVLALARTPRYLGLAWLGQQLGHDAGGWLKAHAWHIVAFAAALFVILFGLIWWKDRQRLRTA
jgi:membrane protein YqaA with SNARE-associated domain